MTEASLAPQVEAAEAYEALFVPALFAEWAPRVADAAGVASGERVLDVGCGTGILAREVVSRVGTDGKVAGVDPGARMLAVARALAPTLDRAKGVMGRWPRSVTRCEPDG